MSNIESRGGEARKVFGNRNLLRVSSLVCGLGSAAALYLQSGKNTAHAMFTGSEMVSSATCTTAASGVATLVSRQDIGGLRATDLTDEQLEIEVRQVFQEDPDAHSHTVVPATSLQTVLQSPQASPLYAPGSSEFYEGVIMHTMPLSESATSLWVETHTYKTLFGIRNPFSMNRIPVTCVPEVTQPPVTTEPNPPSPPAGDPGIQNPEPSGQCLSGAASGVVTLEGPKKVKPGSVQAYVLKLVNNSSRDWNGQGNGASKIESARSNKLSVELDLDDRIAVPSGVVRVKSSRGKAREYLDLPSIASGATFRKSLKVKLPAVGKTVNISAKANLPSEVTGFCNDATSGSKRISVRLQK